MQYVFIRSGIVTLISMCASVMVAAGVMEIRGESLSTEGFLMSLLCPMVIAWPASAWTSLQKVRLTSAHSDLGRMHEELAAAHARLAEQSIRDAMTGLLNRAAFFDRLARTAGKGGGGLLLIIDADHFKSINDTFGHQSGDRALVEIASGIARAASADALVARIGGEEFAVFLPGRDAARAREIALGIRQEVAAVAFHPRGGDRLDLTVSIGGAQLAPGGDVNRAIRLADRRLYAAKRAGRNRVVIGQDDGRMAA